MIEQQVAQAEPTTEPQLSDDDIAAAFRGESIADEVDRPAKKKVAKATVEVAPEPEPEAEAAEEEDEDDDGAPSSFEFDQLKSIAGRQKQRLDDARGELAKVKEENESLKKRAELSLESLYDEDLIAAMSPKERKDLAAYLYYMTETDKADDDTKLFLRERQESVRRRKAEAAMKNKEEEVSRQLAEANATAVRREYVADVRGAVVDMFEDIPALADLYDGDRKRISEAVVDYAERLAQSGSAESDDDLDPSTILKLLEETAVKRTKKQAGSKLIKATQRTKGKAFGSDVEMTEDEENEYLAKVFRG